MFSLQRLIFLEFQFLQDIFDDYIHPAKEIMDELVNQLTHDSLKKRKEKTAIKEPPEKKSKKIPWSKDEDSEFLQVWGEGNAGMKKLDLKFIFIY
jgi:hypothetical protein